MGAAKDAININVPAGTYYIGVYHYNGDTNYDLYLSATDPSKTFNSNYRYGLVDAAASVAFVTEKTSRFPKVPDLGRTGWGLELTRYLLKIPSARNKKDLRLANRASANN